jgi:hypothetical protein
MRDYQGMQFNNTFRGCDPGDYNACVGNNGQPSYTEYANGYVDASIHLIDIAIENQTMDELIYPICFNMRHAIELRLKQFVFALGYIRDSIDLKDFRDTSMHDLGQIWRYYKNKASMVDSRILNMLVEFEAIIQDFEGIDATGQVFRYPYSTDRNKHLVDVGIINVVHLKGQFLRLQRYLEGVHRLNNELSLEYGTGTYTKFLSRLDLKNISECLPQHSLWTSDLDGCLKIKTEIMDTYSISSNEFGIAKRIIEAHHQFAKNVGLTIPLKNSKLSEWLNVFKAYFSVQEEENSLESDLEGILPFSAVTLEAIDDYFLRMHRAEAYCLKNISVEAFIDIFCVYECGRHGGAYSEYYRTVYDGEIQFADRHFTCAEERREYVHYVLAKTNFIQCAVRGLRMLGQEEILTTLAEKFTIVGV